MRTGWSIDDADALIAHARERGDLGDRRQEAERLTDDSFGRALDVLTEAERDELAESPATLPGGETA